MNLSSYSHHNVFFLHKKRFRRTYMKCRVCEERDAVEGKKDCAKCWKYYERANQKFNQRKSRNIEVDFEDRLELAKYLKELYDADPNCYYSGVEMVVEELGKEERLLAECYADPNNKSKRKKLDDYRLSLKNRPFSVDRKISVDENGKKMPYKRGNIVLCTTPINILKGSLTHEVLLNTCFKILQNEVESYRKDSNMVLEKTKEFVKENDFKMVYPTEALHEKVEGKYEQEPVKKAKKNKKTGNGKKPKKLKKKKR